MWRSPSDLPGREQHKLCYMQCHYFLVQFFIFNPFILLKCFSLFVTKIEFIVSAVDAINKSKSSIGEPDFLKICF